MPRIGELSYYRTTADSLTYSLFFCSQAYATLTDFRGQRQMLNNVANRMGNTAAQVPALNGIMTMIARRRRRDSVIMGTVIGGGMFLLLMYITR